VVPGLLFEPLSTQEVRVLRLLAAGLSNPEIARELIVSVNTVKTQVQSIYRKLNVTGRREARERARVLKLV
jgi:LuxR family maltose regulon positive regulatory protein